MPAVFAPTPYLQPTVARREMTCNRWLHVVRRPRIRQAGGSRPRRPRRLRSRDGWGQPGPPRPGRAGQGGPGFWPRAWHGRPYGPLAQRTGADLGRASRFHPQQTRIPARVHDRPDRRVYRHANTDTASATARTVPQGTLAGRLAHCPGGDDHDVGNPELPAGQGHVRRLEHLHMRALASDRRVCGDAAGQADMAADPGASPDRGIRVRTGRGSTPSASRQWSCSASACASFGWRQFCARARPGVRHGARVHTPG
jgi:hypothetical protein